MIINASIQIIPLSVSKEVAYSNIDRVIKLIQESGLKYIIGAFETTIEGEYETVQILFKKLQDVCYSIHEIQFLIYTKMHLCGGKDILIEDKKLDRV